MAPSQQGRLPLCNGHGATVAFISPAGFCGSRPYLLHKRLRCGYLVSVATDSGLRAGLPQPFSELVGPPLRFATALPLPEIHGLDGTWLHVKGAWLPAPIVIRVDRAADGRYMITGLLLGWRQQREITWQTLRNLKLAAVLEEIFAGFDPSNPMKALGDLPSGRLSELSAPALAAAHLYDRLEPNLYVRQVQPADGDQPAETRGRRGPSADDLEAFANVYRRLYATQPRRAMTAAAAETSVSRATAIRYAARCREVGLLPPKDQP